MNCFNHPNVPAVGICKYCQKGLCMECAVDLGRGIACKNHQEEVEILNNTGRFFLQVSLIFIPLGFVAIFTGLFMDIFMDITEPILIFMGLGMLVFGALYSTIGSKLRKPKSK